MTDYNAPVIEEFRANHGKVGGFFEGKDMLLLHTIGARSGKERIAPVLYRRVGDAYAVFASKAGAHTHPDWYHNLLANPEVTIEVGDETLDVTARTLEGEERSAVWEAQKAEVPMFAGYEEKTDREIPVVLLETR